MDYIFLIVILVFMIVMMVVQTRKSKQQQQERKNFWDNMQPGTLVQTIGGLIGSVVEVDQEYEEVVLESEGSRLRFSFKAISREYVRPAYVHDDEVDENGNPIQQPQEVEGIPAQPEGAQGVEGAPVAQEYTGNEAVAGEDYVETTEAEVEEVPAQENNKAQ